jgi:hypothetical protein
VNRQRWVDYAEIIDKLRIYPRVFLIACFFWTVYISHMLLKWYMAMPKDERGIEASGFASVVFVTIFGFLKLVYGEYTRAGKDWSAVGTTSTSQTTATTTVIT